MIGHSFEYYLRQWRYYFWNACQNKNKTSYLIICICKRPSVLFYDVIYLVVYQDPKFETHGMDTHAAPRTFFSMSSLNLVVDGRARFTNREIDVLIWPGSVRGVGESVIDLIDNTSWIDSEGINIMFVKILYASSCTGFCVLWIRKCYLIL